jgi:hypothetical protein
MRTAEHAAGNIHSALRDGEGQGLRNTAALPGLNRQDT